MKDTLYGHAREAVALPGMLLTSLLWPLVPKKTRKQVFDSSVKSGVRSGLKSGAESRQPIICIPGYAHNNSCYILLMKRLQNAGLGPVISYNYHPLLGSIEGHAERLASLIEHTLDNSDHHKVSIIGHSMGGLVARHYLQELSGLDNVEKLITLETPHQGLAIGRYAPGKCAKQMAPEHHFMKKIKEGTASLKDLPILGIYSDINPISAMGDTYKILDGKSDFFVSGYGHASVLYTKPIAEKVITFLKPS